MNIKDLEKIFEEAKNKNNDVALELTVPTREDTEIIIVKNANLDYKLQYYKKAYNADLVLNNCKDIKILNAKTLNFVM